MTKDKTFYFLENEWKPKIVKEDIWYAPTETRDTQYIITWNGYTDGKDLYITAHY